MRRGPFHLLLHVRSVWNYILENHRHPKREDPSSERNVGWARPLDKSCISWSFLFPSCILCTYYNFVLSRFAYAHLWNFNYLLRRFYRRYGEKARICERCWESKFSIMNFKMNIFIIWNFNIWLIKSSHWIIVIK